jgi:uncharacterized damage-inducible protein DinB
VKLRTGFGHQEGRALGPDRMKTSTLRDAARPSAASFALPNRVAEPLLALLDQIDRLIAAVTDAQYVRADFGTVEGSIGAHVRHGLDHVRALVACRESGRINYDERDRGTPIETDREAARAAIRDLSRGMDSLKPADLERAVRITAMLAPDLSPVEFRSTLGRELSFVISHTIHHNAILGVFARSMNVEIPSDFGYAPSTVAHRAQSVRSSA